MTECMWYILIAKEVHLVDIYLIYGTNDNSIYMEIVYVDCISYWLGNDLKCKK